LQSGIRPLAGARRYPAPGTLRTEIVSFDDEDLILVDEQDRITGYDSKHNAHQGMGKLHRAFSIFLFDGPDWVLLQRRSETKPLWPAYWANSCCSHPRRGETCDDAVSRRLPEELGANTPLTRLYDFQYQARYHDRGSEHELCAVYVGQYSRNRALNVNRTEIQEYGWFSRREVNRWIGRQPQAFAPWFLLEWRELNLRGFPVSGANPR
jgi:isopentenyl-diphosphate delta-isomerase